MRGRVSVSVFVLLFSVSAWAQAPAPQAPVVVESVDSLKADNVRKDATIKALADEIVRLRVELKTQSAAARDLSQQIVRVEIQQQQQRQEQQVQRVAAARAGIPVSSKPESGAKPAAEPKP